MLLKKNILEGNMDDALINDLITMESKMVFADSSLVVIPNNKEQNVLNKLNKSLTKGVGFWWPIATIAVVLALSLLVWFKFTTSNQSAAMAASQSNNAYEKDNTPNNIINTSDSTLVEKPENETLRPKEIDTNTQVTEEKIIQNISLWPNPFTAPLDSIKSNNIVYYKATAGIVVSENKFTVDTLFNGIKSLHIKSTYCKIDIKPNNTETLLLKGEMEFKSKGIVINKPQYHIIIKKTDTLLQVTIEGGKSSIVLGGMVDITGFLNFVVPQNINVKIDNTSSDILLTKLKGQMKINNDYGNVHATDMQSNMILKVQSGNTTLKAIEGNITTDCDYGNQTLTNINGHVNMKNNSSDITLANIKGNTLINASYGNIHIDSLAGKLRIKLVSGNITTKHINGDSVDINNSYGNIVLSHVEAAIKANNISGNTHFNHVKGNVKLSSSYGKQKLANITGSIISKGVSTEVELEKIEGDLNITTSYGDITASNCKGAVAMNVTSGNISGKNITLTNNMLLNNTYGNIKMQLTNTDSDLSYDLVNTYGTIKLAKGDNNIKKTDGSLKITKGAIEIKAVTTSGNQLFE
ncbi:MAG: DUF4097 family beta strand repeat-containing protein [Bacteroidota bacterium]